MRYNPKAIESKWQKKWLKDKTYEPDLKGKSASGRRPYYNLMMFPYPSAEGLHVGNMYAFTGSDIHGRFQRMQGLDVFEPIGLDGFGIHSENYALKIGKHPAKQSKVSEQNFYRQLSEIGNGFAWDEHLETYDPDYYKWTQWIFTEMFKKGLAYRKKAKVNWCPSCKTVLADEQVIQGKCERCSSEVIRKDLEQWFFRITNYAERLLDNLEKIDWSPRVKIAQINWIGKSEGAEIEFRIQDSGFSIKVFTTRPDTLFGATYMVLAPEHKLIENLKIKIKNWGEVEKYIKTAAKKTEIERTAETKAKTGVELRGVKAINPATKEEIPIWVADYVLAGYGTGAIMAVPAHDERDFAFAEKFNLPVKIVIEPETGKIMPNEESRKSIVAIVEDPETKKFLTLDWGPKLGGTLFIGGGREEGEDKTATALREIREETGYTDLVFVQKTERMHHHYFAFSEGVARNIEVSGLHFRLAGGGKARKNLQHDEKGNFKIEWLNADEILRRMEDENHLLSFRRLILGEVYTGDGLLTASGAFDGADSRKAKWEITKFVRGERKTQYRLRDWLISRQRYWGPPIPLVFCENCAGRIRNQESGIRNIFNKGEMENPGWIAVPDKDLLVKLPFVKNFRPTGTGQSPLASVKSFYETKCPKCKGKARRETDVSDTFLDSAWYFLRYPSVGEKKLPWNEKITRRWLPVDMYIGGAEHSVLHLLYSRFLTMVFHDWGLLDFEEPYKKFRAHGLIIKDGAKMSKSKGNIVNPDDYIRAYGADALRLYLMFTGPFQDGGDFRDAGIAGMTRFLQRVWRLVREKQEASSKKQGIRDGGQGYVELERAVQRTIKKVTEDIEALRYNTAISALMILLNEFEARPSAVTSEAKKTFLQLLAPLAPHITEELWARLKQKGSIHHSPWPTYDPQKIESGEIDLVVQINGRVRGRLRAPREVTEAEAATLAQKDSGIAKYLAGAPKKIIFVPGRLINFVI